MIWREEVDKIFWQTVKDYDCPQELKTALKTHERTKKVIEMIADELTKAERSLKENKNKTISLKTMRSAAQDLTKGFIQNVEMQADRRRESILSRLAREAEIQKREDIDKTLDGEASGVYADMGIKLGNDTVEDVKDGQNGETA